jgi:hypothetical protein
MKSYGGRIQVLILSIWDSRSEFFFGINLFDHALIIRLNKITAQLI